MIIIQPDKSEYPAYFGTYIEKIQQNDLLKSLKDGVGEMQAFARMIPTQKTDYRYAEGKWSVKEVLSHLTDAERVFSYRAMRFSRNDKTELPGFDENVYVPESNAAARTLEGIVNEFIHVRHASISLFESFTDEMLSRKGIASGKEISVRALGFCLAGHQLHHTNVIKERYL